MEYVFDSSTVGLLLSPYYLLAGM